MRRKLQEQRCAGKGDVRAHFDKMITLHKELASLGHSVSSDDFCAMLLSSVPMSYESTISAMTTSARITGLDLTPEVILMTLIDDYDQRQAKSGKKSSSGGEDVAYCNGRIVYLFILSHASILSNHSACLISLPYLWLWLSQ